MDLFTHRARKDPSGRPLAERMRPRALDELVGQRHLLAPGKLLAEVGEVPSLILWGPPGTGKTTLARLLAARSNARFAPLSAVSAGVKDLREVIADAERARGESGQRTILFLDEIHRFNKAQQDALLPTVEAGVITLIGATTENPSFEVNAALLSRCRVVRLEPLEERDLRQLIDRALSDRERGLGAHPIDCDEAARAELARKARGDGRRALTTLEVAFQVARVVDGRKRIDLAAIEEALQAKTLLYGEDEHYDVVSAFIKSMRGSDPDAALYWMVRMVDAGDDPLFVLRRMVIFAAEDVGVADPRALQVAMAATEAFRFVGMPEGILPMAEACLYLATAPKTNTALTASAAARAAALAHGALPVPKHLRNAPTKLAKEMGHGAGYQYPHDHDGAVVSQTFLPEKLVGERFYEPKESGYEKTIVERLRWIRQKKQGQGGG